MRPGRKRKAKGNWARPELAAIIAGTKARWAKLRAGKGRGRARKCRRVPPGEQGWLPPQKRGGPRRKRRGRISCEGSATFLNPDDFHELFAPDLPREQAEFEVRSQVFAASKVRMVRLLVLFELACRAMRYLALLFFCLCQHGVHRTASRFHGQIGGNAAHESENFTAN